MKKSDIELQNRIREQLSDTDDLVIDSNGVHIAQYWCRSEIGSFPCASLSLALSCAKKCLKDGQDSIVIEKI